MRRLIAIACAVMLTACVANPKQTNPMSARAGSGVIVAGTLSLGPCEMSVAALRTRNAVAAQKVSRRVVDGRIDKARAREFLVRLSGVRDRLDAVCELDRANIPHEAAAVRNRAERTLADVEADIKEIP